jgi:hypothetical protein
MGTWSEEERPRREIRAAALDRTYEIKDAPERARMLAKVGVMQNTYEAGGNDVLAEALKLARAS